MIRCNFSIGIGVQVALLFNITVACFISLKVNVASFYRVVSLAVDCNVNCKATWSPSKTKKKYFRGRSRILFSFLTFLKQRNIQSTETEG